MVNYLNSYTFHISLYDLAFLGTIITGLNFALQLLFAKRTSQAANPFLGLALATMVLWMARVWAISIGLGTYIPHWSWLPMQFSLGFGPLIYFYVLKMTQPAYIFRRKDLLHFSPLLPQLGGQVWEVKESITTGAATYDTLAFQQLNQAIQILVFISVIVYLYRCHRLIESYYQGLKFNQASDRYRYELRWLHRLLTGFGLLWLLWIPYTAVDYFFYHHHLSLQAYYPLYLLLAIVFTRMAIVICFRPETGASADTPAFHKPLLPAELKQKGSWLKKTIKAHGYYRDPELSLSTLAEKLGLHPHELSRIINTVLKKNFNDFINEYRVEDVAQKMQDPAYDRFTLLGIAFDSGFNSKTTFNRIFRQMTGKSAAEYKSDLKKESPTYHLGPDSRSTALVSGHETIPQWSYEQLNRNFMFRNYLKIASRQLYKQKMYSVIKIGGFAFSLAACILIALYIKDELSYDRSYPHAERIYRIVGYYNDHGNQSKWASFPAPLAGVIKANYPEVETVGRLMPNNVFAGAGSNEVKRSDQVVNTYEDGFTYGDQQLLDVLGLPMLYGSKTDALKEPLSMVITKKKADKYFPGQNPVGKVMYLNNDKSKPYHVTGVIPDFPATSHLKYSFILTLSGVNFGNGEQTDWGSNNYTNYILVRPGTNISSLETKITADITRNYYLPSMLSSGDKNAEKEVQQISLHLQPISDINLYSGDIQDNLAHGDIRFIWLFGAVASFILIIACINFINLSTAKSANRAKEVGIRKVAGCQRSGLIMQFLTESIVLSLLSFVLALITAWLLLSYFNTLSSKSLIMPWAEWWLIPAFCLAAIMVGLLAGLYPSFYLSAFNPVQVLKGNISTGSKGSALRNGLVIFQFTASIALIISTIVIYCQMQYVLNRKVGFDKDQVVLVEGTQALGDNVTSFKNELSKLAAVKSVAVSDYLPVAGTKRNGNTFWNEGKTKEETGTNAQLWQVDDTYLNTMGMKLLAGRNFAKEISGDRQSVIINQTMAKQLGLKDPVGKRITNGSTFTVIGVVQDFNFETMRSHIEPLALQFGLSPSIVSVKVKTADMKNTLQSITATWKSFAPGQPLRYTFLDERFARMYADVQRMSRIFTSFAVLAVMIACLGLFALSAFMAEQRKKEIGIRKVLGASVHSVTTLLSLDFIKPVLIAMVIASPIAWWAMHTWLQDFAYRISIPWWAFVLSGSGTVLIAFVTISFQSIKAAVANPVKSLKSE